MDKLGGISPLSFNSFTRSIHPWVEKTQQYLIRWYRVIIFVVTVFVSIFELIEHPNFLNEIKHEFFIELGLYYSLILISVVLLEVALRAARIKNQAVRISDARHEISIQLSAAKNWDEVVSTILQYPATITKVSAASLLLYDQVSNSYKIQGNWSRPGEQIKITSNAIPAYTCCSTDTKDPNQYFHQVDCADFISLLDQNPTCYHLAINYRQLPVGVLHIICNHNDYINQEDAQLLSKTAEDIAIGLHAANQRREQHAIEVANAASNERLEIARDLHDTLGQNLGYLHLKLDQILTNNPQEVPQEVVNDLTQLRELSNESYELVRNTLAILHRRNDHQISELIKAHALLIARRAKITFKIEEKGEPLSIPPKHLRQLFYAFKETLYNIEKHANATHIDVWLTWTENSLKVSISDDGCGFDQNSSIEDGHYGLNIIKDRIRSLGGRVDISSSLGDGTEISLWLPL